MSRIRNRKRENIAKIYSKNKVYFVYLPLNHALDSLLINKCKELQNLKTLSVDEKIICTLFAGKIENYNSYIKREGKRKSQIKRSLRKKYREYNNNEMGYNIYTGVFQSLQSLGFYTYSPMIGATLTTPLRNKLIVELGFKFRFNENDRSFKYQVEKDTCITNSPNSIFIGFLVGYKLYERKNIILLPKVGIGFEALDTGISIKKDDSEGEDRKYIKTVNLSLGFSIMTPIFRRSYIGLGVNLHYCPYNFDNKLLTSIDTNLFSTELFFRF